MNELVLSTVSGGPAVGSVDVHMQVLELQRRVQGTQFASHLQVRCSKPPHHYEHCLSSVALSAPSSELLICRSYKGM